MDKLDIFFEKLAAFMEKAAEAPMVMWRGTANEPGNRLMLLVFLAAFAGGALYLLLAFLKAPLKEKMKMLGTAIILMLILLVIFWFALGM